MTIDVNDAAEDSFEALIESAIVRMPEDVQPLAAQALRAAQGVHEHGFGYLGGLVNMRVIESEDGASHLTMDVTPNALNGYGYVHGGMLFTMADYAMGAAAKSLVKEGESPVTLEAKANYVGNVKEGQLVARCETLHHGKHLITLETRIFNAETDELIMIVTGTFYIIREE